MADSGQEEDGLAWFLNRACNHPVLTQREEKEIFDRFLPARDAFKAMVVCSLAGARALFYLLEHYDHDNIEWSEDKVSYDDIFYTPWAGKKITKKKRQALKEETIAMIKEHTDFIRPRLSKLKNCQHGRYSFRAQKVLADCAEKFLAMPITLALYKKVYSQAVAPMASPAEKLVAEAFFSDLHLIIKYNHRGVYNIAKKLPRGAMVAVSLLDDIQAGEEGLIRSLDTFNGSVRFSTYYTHWVRQAILRQRAKTALTVRVPAGSIIQAISRAQMSMTELEADLEKELNQKRSSQAKAAQRTAVLAINAVKSDGWSLDAPHPGHQKEKQKSWGENMADDKLHGLDLLIAQTTPADIRAAVERVIEAHLKNTPFDYRARNKRIIMLYYCLTDGEKRSLDAVGKMCGGLTRERVRQIIKRFEEWAKENGPKYGLSPELLND